MVLISMFYQAVYSTATIQRENPDMGSLRRTYDTNDSKETDGVWIDVCVNDDDTIGKMKIRRMGSKNKKFQKKFSAELRKLKGRAGDKSDSERMALVKTFVETCLVDWVNIENVNEGSPDPYMPCTYENAMLLFKELPDLFDVVLADAQDITNFQDQDEEAAKNSLSSSSTS